MCLLQVLYLKNLGPRVTMKDLVALFARFQKEDRPLLQFRLLSGRMRDQAFITFPGECCLLPLSSSLPPTGVTSFHRALGCCQACSPWRSRGIHSLLFLSCHGPFPGLEGGLPGQK